MRSTALISVAAIAGAALLTWYRRGRTKEGEATTTQDEAQATVTTQIETEVASEEQQTETRDPPMLVVLHSGDLAEEAATMVIDGARERFGIHGETVCMSTFKAWAEAVNLGKEGQKELIAVFIVATIENEQPPECAGTCVRYFNRKTHPEGMLAKHGIGPKFTVLGLGDSNLLLDRQTTKAKDCNQVAQKLDGRLSELGGECFYARGEVDDRTGNLELQPWLDGLWLPLKQTLRA